MCTQYVLSNLHKPPLPSISILLPDPTPLPPPVRRSSSSARECTIVYRHVSSSLYTQQPTRMAGLPFFTSAPPLGGQCDVGWKVELWKWWTHMESASLLPRYVLSMFCWTWKIISVGLMLVAPPANNQKRKDHWIIQGKQTDGFLPSSLLSSSSLRRRLSLTLREITPNSARLSFLQKMYILNIYLWWKSSRILYQKKKK